MQLIQLATKLSKCISLIGRIWRQSQRMKVKVNRIETDYNMLSDDFERLYRRVDSLERTESRFRQAVG